MLSKWQNESRALLFVTQSTIPELCPFHYAGHPKDDLHHPSAGTMTTLSCHHWSFKNTRTEDGAQWYPPTGTGKGGQTFMVALLSPVLPQFQSYLNTGHWSYTLFTRLVKSVQHLIHILNNNSHSYLNTFIIKHNFILLSKWKTSITCHK